MSYMPPDSYNVVFDFTTNNYTPPDAHNIVFDFGSNENPTQYIVAGGLDYLKFGATQLKTDAITISPSGFIGSSFGSAKVVPTQFIKTTGYLAAVFGSINVLNLNREINPSGFNSSIVSSSLKIYNLKQNLALSGFSSALYGSSYLQGGVKYLSAIG